MVFCIAVVTTTVPVGQLLLHLWDTHRLSLVNNSSNSLIAWARGISTVMTDQSKFAISSPFLSLLSLPPFLFFLFLFLFFLLTNLISVAWIKGFALGRQAVFLSQLFPALLFSICMSAHISMSLPKIASQTYIVDRDAN